jgi:phosphoribosyl 1,2-cyclic phosphodiesterase
MRITPLASGSRGNATLVEFPSADLFGGLRILVDAGLSSRELERRLAAVEVEPGSIDAIVLTHEHDDHARGAQRFSGRHGVALCCTPATLDALDRSPTDFASWMPLECGVASRIGEASCLPFRVPHDAAEPVGFVLECRGKRFGIVTDLGHATADVVKHLSGCQVLMIEANHDERMLQQGPYPWALKRRVSGATGHLSNREAAALVEQVAREESRWVVLAHLSEKNNTEELAEAQVSRTLRRIGAARTGVRVAMPGVPTPSVEV